MGASLLRRRFSTACRSFSLLHAASGDSVSAATRSLMPFFSFVAIATGPRLGLFAAVRDFFTAFELFAALRFFAMFLSPRAKHVRQIAHRRSRILGVKAR